MTERLREVGQALFWAASFLKSKDIDSPRLEAEVLLAHCLDCSRSELLVEPHNELAAEQDQTFQLLVRKRGSRYPLQYLTGRQEFMSLDFVVNPDVLIPRQDTEILVETVLQRLPDTSLKVVDVGCGSGAIAISLAYYRPRWEVWATDISKQALRTAAKNAERMGVNLQLKQGNLLFPLQEQECSFELVVSNPPYIAFEELQNLPPEVNYEPRPALNGGRDGLDVYRSLLPQAEQLLVSKGILAVEIGYDQGGALVEMLGGNWCDVEVIKDYGDRDRVVIAKKSKGSGNCSALEG